MAHAIDLFPVVREVRVRGAEGGIQAEWSISDWEASLEIDLPTKGASLQALNLVTRELHEHDLVLTSIEGWQQINAVLK